MKKTPRNVAPRRTDPVARDSAPESRDSAETLPKRSKPPAAGGLGNESRPGLGARKSVPVSERPVGKATPKPATDDNAPNVSQRQRSGLEPNDKPFPREPEEQRSDSWEQEAERSTGVSGHLGSA